MQTFPWRRLTAISFLLFDTLLAQVLPFSIPFVMAVIYRLDKKIFYLGAAVAATELIWTVLNPKNISWVFPTALAMIKQQDPKDWPSFEPLIPWLLPIYASIMIFSSLLSTIVFARLVDKLYLWKRIKRVFAIWGLD